MHAPFRRIVPGAECAVLFIHGINATPRFFDETLSAVPENCSVHALLLPGHGGTVKDFARHTSAEWTAHVRAAVEELRKTHRRLYIVGHSLGTLLAIREAVREDRQIAGLLLLCVPLRIWSRPSAWVRNTGKALLGITSPEELRTCYGTEIDWRVWRYIGWIPRYLELFRESAAARQEIARLNVPTIAFMAKKDEQVSLRSVKEMEGNPAIEVRYMPDSRHHEFAPGDKAAVTAALRAMLQDT
ncbi:MAG: alpha/beta fold hydrolase [Clostridia bacterium]|nr:alpha/beta fold hydrolase [Clostridia bacterium]